MTDSALFVARVDRRTIEIELTRKIEVRSARICVVGLGYVGLTAACALAANGFEVVGVEIDATRVRQVNAGVCPFPASEPGLAELLTQQLGAGRLRASSDHAMVADADIILIVVQTPVGAHTHTPDLTALHAALDSVAANLRPRTLVVIESTIAPGTTRNVVIPRLQEGSGLLASRDFLVACCPERVMPGRLLANLGTYSRVVGGWSHEAGQVAATLYRNLTSGVVDETDCLTAELVKSTENAYRDVQIAFANEVALLCESYGADVFAVRELVNKSPGRAMLLPGAGVGGHCIPKDSWLLVSNAPPTTPVRVIPAARAVNDYMPHHMGEIVAQLLSTHGRGLEDSRVAILGLAYLADSDDARNSPSAELRAWLEQRGVAVSVHDPLVSGCDRDVARVVTGVDCAVVMVAHSAYKALDLKYLREVMRTPSLADGRHCIDPDNARSAGLTYRCLGIGR